MDAATAVPEVICVGQAVVDCITRGREDLTPTVSRAASITMSAGGDAVNESVAIAQMGHSAGVVIALGQDLAGDMVKKVLTDHGVDTSRAVRMDAPFATPIANLLVRLDGTRRSISSTASLLPGFVPDSASLSGARVVSLASLFRAPFLDPAVVADLARAAKEAGAIVCADTKLPNYVDLGLDDLRDALACVDYFFPNESEAAHFTGRDDFPGMAEVLLGYGIGCVIIKAGDKGCYVATSEGGCMVPALECEVVDATGAGDHFVAGFICGLLEDKPLLDCVHAGRELASASLAYSGAIMPDEAFA